MHRAIARNLASVCREGGGPEPGPGGMNRRHLACAILAAGDPGSNPPRTGNPPLPFGSGKLGIPLERMHLAKAIIACCRLDGLSGEAPLPSGLGCEALFVEERCATPGLVEEPPQPASASATPRMAAAASRRARGEVNLLVWMLCGILSPSGFASGFRGIPDRVLRGGLFRRCFALRGRQRFCSTGPAKQR
jgi:hypothetical protein